MKHKTLNLLIYFIILFSISFPKNWIEYEDIFYKKYSFDSHHSTYNFLSDSLHYIISNIANENYSKKYSTIIAINDKGILKNKLELNQNNNYLLSGKKLKNGDFLFIGYNQSNNDAWNKIYVIKTDRNLNILWEKNYGSDNYESKGYSIIEYKNDEYWILGYTEASKNNALLLKIDSNGNEKWFSYLPKLNCTFASHMIINENREIIIAGQNAKQLFVSKIDNNGNVLWTYNYLNNNHYHRLYEIKNTNDNGIIIAGNTTKDLKNKKDILIIKLTDNGKQEWINIFGNKDSEVAYDIEQISKENYAIGGFSLKDKKGLLYNSFVIKTDSLGNQLSRIDLNNLSSNKLYDLNIKYNNKTKTIIYSGVGDIIKNENSEILFINFQEEKNN